MQRYLIVWTKQNSATMTGGQIIIETSRDPIRIVEKIKADLGGSVAVSIIAI